MLLSKIKTLAAALSCTVALSANSALALPVEVAARGDDAPWQEPLAARLDALRRKVEVRGSSIAVVHGDNTWLHAFGHKNLDRTDPVDVDTSFLIGSVTKSFTALGAAKAVAQGKMYWSKPLKDYVREFYPGYLGLWDPEADNKVTLGDLLSHRTGVAGNFPVILAWNTTEALLQHLKLLPPSAPYGTRFQYNNIMYGLAGYLTGKATRHADWASQIHADIFEPLGMNASTATMKDFMETANRSPGESPETDFLEDSVLPVTPAGVISSTARDLGKYAHGLLQMFRGESGPFAIPPEVFAPFRENQVELDAEEQQVMQGLLLNGRNISDVSYTFGFNKAKWRNYTLFVHGGNNHGYASNLCLLPEGNVAVSVLTNAEGSRGCFREAACAAAFDAVLGTGDSTSYDCPVMPMPPLPSAGRLPLSTSAYTGAFESPVMGKMIVGVDAQGNLTMSVGERRKFFEGRLYAPEGAAPTAMDLLGVGPPGSFPLTFTAKADANATAVEGYYFVLDPRGMTKICDKPGPECQEFFKRVGDFTPTPPKCPLRPN
ncbi:beta-lactamase/transpeptidase-like protein [Powellomyces hirtus]|nr:beta-lactamase/transpeptidase-like protein [Powellomyces hirtus]